MPCAVATHLSPGHIEHVPSSTGLTLFGPLADARRLAYREHIKQGRTKRRLRRDLVAARDALDLALWTLDTRAKTRRELEELNERALDCLLEATQALSRARVHHPAIRSLNRPVLLAGHRDPRVERGRLRDAADRLLWWNHESLPARAKVIPLGPEDEAQLARVHRALAGHRRLAGLSRHRWFMAFAVAGALTPVFGAAAGLAAVAFGTLEIGAMARARPLRALQG